MNNTVPFIPETELAICPDCGVELVVRLADPDPVPQVSALFARIYPELVPVAWEGYVFPVHPKPQPNRDYELCPTGGTPVYTIPVPHKETS